MTVYQQQVGLWASLPLGVSGLLMENDGCFVTACAQILTLAGWDITPGILCTDLNENNGFTSEGLAIWSKITDAFPQFIFGGSAYHLVQGYNKSTGLYHWWVQTAAGDVYDPWTGTANHPAGYLATGSTIGITCVPYSPPPTQVIVEDTAAPEPTTFWVQLDAALHIRTHPSISAPIVGTYTKGKQILCKGTAAGDSVNGNVTWYVSDLHGYYFTAAYSHIIETPPNTQTS